MSQLFFTSDHHFGHANIIKFCNRPFKDVQEMNETLIERWNKKVKPKDHVYHLCESEAMLSGVRTGGKTSPTMLISNRYISKNERE